MSDKASCRLVLLQGGGEGAVPGTPPRAFVLSVITSRAEPEPPPEDRIAEARLFRRELEARIARPVEDLL